VPVHEPEGRGGGGRHFVEVLEEPEFEEGVDGDGEDRDEDGHWVGVGLEAIVLGDEVDEGGPALLRVVAEEDVGHGDDDERLGGVRQAAEHARHGAEQDLAADL
jgi:hypothetical protein